MASELITTGGYAQIYKCELEPNVYCAMKIPKNKRLTSEFAREIAILKQIDHPNIVKLFRIDVNAGVISYTMEYLPLCIYQRPNNEPIATIRHWLVQLMLAINHLHTLGITHGDINPANVMLNDRNQLILCDFGLAFKGYSDITFDNTSYYYAPEITECFGIDSNVDIWGAGVIAVNLCGPQLVHATTHKEYKDAIASTLFARPFDTFITRCAEMKSSDRAKPRELLALLGIDNPPCANMNIPFIPPTRARSLRAQSFVDSEREHYEYDSFLCAMHQFARISKRVPDHFTINSIKCIAYLMNDSSYCELNDDATKVFLALDGQIDLHNLTDLVDAYDYPAGCGKIAILYVKKLLLMYEIYEETARDPRTVVAAAFDYVMNGRSSIPAMREYDEKLHAC